MPTVTNALLKSSLRTRGGRSLNFSIAEEEVIGKVNFISLYFSKISRRTEKQILVSTYCRSNPFLYFVLKELFEGPPSASQPEVLKGPSGMFLKRKLLMMLCGTKHFS